MHLKPTGERVLATLPFLILCLNQENRLATTDEANLEDRKITANETRVDLLENRSSLSTSFRRFQQLPLQENLRQRIQRPPVPPQHLQHGQLQQTRRLLQRELLQRNAPDHVLLPFIVQLHAALHVIYDDHHLIEALVGLVRHPATTDSPAQ